MSKRTRKDERLEEADSIAESQALITPTEQEKNCIANFCSLSLKHKKLENDAKETLKDVKPIVKDLRDDILERMKVSNFEIVQIPQAMRKEANARLQDSLPPYIRVIKNTKDISITSEIIEEALENLSEEEVQEKQGDVEAIVEALLCGVRRLIRSFNEQAKLTDSIPRGVKPADIEFADEDLAREAIRLHEQNNLVLKTEKEKRDRQDSFKVDIEKQGEVLKGFFQRANTCTQRVNMEGQAYNLCCRTTVTRPKVTIKVLQEFVIEGVKECLIPNKRGKINKSELISALSTKKEELKKCLSAKMATVKSTSKTVVHLQRIATKPPKNPSSN